MRRFAIALAMGFSLVALSGVSTTAQDERCAVQWRITGTFAGPGSLGRQLSAARSSTDRPGVPLENSSLRHRRPIQRCGRPFGLLLRGVVPDAAARARAVELTRDTYEVTGVVDELETIIPAPSPTTTAPAPAVTVPSLSRPR